MSIEAINWCKTKNCNTPSTKLVLVWLANYADQDHSCFPSEKHLGELCGISDRQVRRCIDWLEKMTCLPSNEDLVHQTGIFLMWTPVSLWLGRRLPPILKIKK